MTAHLDAARHPERPLIDAVRALIALAVPAAVESIKWNAPSFATAEHFATFHLRAKVGIQLVLHRGARPKGARDMRQRLTVDAPFLEWKDADRAVVSIRDHAQPATMRDALTRVIREWAMQVEEGADSRSARHRAPPRR